MAENKYIINLIQNLNEEYVIMVYANSKNIAKIVVGLSKQEALINAGHIADAFGSTKLNDQTD